MRLTRAEAEAYRARWALVRAAELAELRDTPPLLKLRQLAALMSSVDALGWREALAADEDGVRDRWRRLREALGY